MEWKDENLYLSIAEVTALTHCAYFVVSFVVTNTALCLKPYQLYKTHLFPDAKVPFQTADGKAELFLPFCPFPFAVICD